VAKTLVILITSAVEVTTFRFRQSDLAATLGMSRQTLSTALRKLERLELVTTGYGEISLVDRKKLIAWLDGRGV